MQLCAFECGLRTSWVLLCASARYQCTDEDSSIDAVGRADCAGVGVEGAEGLLGGWASWLGGSGGGTEE